MQWFDPTRVDAMAITETTSKKTTYFDPVLVFDEADGLVSVGLKRNYLIETESSGKTERETGDQWLVHENKKFVWKNETTNGEPVYIVTVPQDMWALVQRFVYSIKGA